MKKKLILAILCSSVFILEAVSRPAVRITGRRFKDRQSLNSFLEKLNQLFGFHSNAPVIAPSSSIVENVNAPISQEIAQPVTTIVASIDNSVELVVESVNEGNPIASEIVEAVVEVINVAAPVSNQPEILDIPLEVVASIVVDDMSSVEQAVQLDQSEILSDVVQIPADSNLTDIKRNEKCGCHHNNKPRADNTAAQSNCMICDKCGCHYQKPKDK